MAPVEVEVTISSAKDLKNVNWRHGDLRPYAVIWVDKSSKSSTRVDDRNDTDPTWNEKLTILLPDRRAEDSTLYIDIVHANAEDGVKPVIGSARLPLAEVLDEVGLGQKCFRKLKLKRPSGRPHGKLEVEVEVREPRYYAPPPAAYAPPYGQGQQSSSRDLPYAYGAPPYAAAAPPPAGYPYNPSPYGQPAGYGQQPAYGYEQQPGYGYGQQPGYGQPAYGASAPVQEKKSKFGVGTGLAVGAAAGLLGGLAIAEGVDYMENKIADDAAEKVEDDLAYDNDGGGDDDY
ncbi:hypothetical protein MRB53_021201 [Persea americana]|uniref:Uncharacterized protein n=1 Tax=Persea americana TaxID=3435 RepID=A0ACC2L373_PERAE|nr:hypothetical protein MRB53_021201 [Persea americana]|eukprot:TRINITY_DN4844_c0_g1_i1.p2 TRINITY_DN4844_c0_g1~~TRINITY_DN4844_c0_g1_i1.p2  ORF type:complete len:288 (+),score=45.86 TRINITY_DN4844_c0_g1_i1:203-1066(+)